MLIERAALQPGRQCALRIAGGRIVDIAPRLRPQAGEEVFDAAGAAVLPGLHDHHVHLLAYAAALESVPCGPEHQRSDAGLAAALRHAAENGGEQEAGGRSARAALGERWLRGIGYHDSVAGAIDRDWLDAVVPACPVRIQHRSGQLWILNSRALALLGVRDGDGDDPFERLGGRLTGRLYGADGWLRERLGNPMPTLAGASRRLARFGITGLTDAGPANGVREFEHFAAEQACGNLRQAVLMMGSADLDALPARVGLEVGPTKLYLRESALPSFDELCADIRRSHAASRAVAVHCVTLAELVLAVEAIRHCGAHPGDRLEHASLCSPEALALVKAAGLSVVTQPNFVFERGDAYLAELPVVERAWLYRGRSFLDAGIALAAGTDFPFGDAHPWRALAAAVERRSRGGRALGAAEALTPMQALGLLCTDPQRPGRQARTLALGAPADLCVLDRGWKALLGDLAATRVRLTLRAGEAIWREDA